MGLAVYNCITLDISFPIVCYRKLLASLTRPPPTITHPADNPAPSSLASTSQARPSKAHVTPTHAPALPSHQLVGVVPVNLDDLKGLDPVSLDLFTLT